MFLNLDVVYLTIDKTLGFGLYLNVAFFTRTRAQLLEDPDAGDQLGPRMVAIQVPEPGVLVGLGAIALLAYPYEGVSLVQKEPRPALLPAHGQAVSARRL